MDVYLLSFIQVIVYYWIISYWIKVFIY